MIRFEPDVYGGAAAIEKARATERGAVRVIARAARDLLMVARTRTKGAVVSPDEWRDVVAHASSHGLTDADKAERLDIATAVGLLVVRKEREVEAVPTLVGPFTAAQRAEISELIRGERLLRVSDLDLPSHREFDLAAQEAADPLGIAYQHEARGRMLVVALRPPPSSPMEEVDPLAPASRAKRAIGRRYLYGLVEQEHALAAVRAFVERIHADLGPGRVWTCGPRVGPVVDDGLAFAIKRDGKTLVVLRSIFFHEHDPEAT